MTAIGPPVGALGSMADVGARIGAIQARIDGLVGTAPGRTVAVFDLPALDDPADPAGPPEGAEVPAGGVGQPGGPAATTVVDAAVGASVRAPSLGQDARGELLASRLPEHGRHLAGAIERAAVDAGIEPSLLAAVVRHESNFDQNVVSHAGAIGLAQLMPGTAAALGVDPHDPVANLAGGARYLREQLDRFGSPELALAAYNAGPNRVAQAGGVPRIAETQAYVGRVLSTWEQLR